MSLWLDRLNEYRSLANLPAVSEDPTLSTGDQQLTSYELTSHNYGHLTGQNTNPNYNAAQQSNISFSGQVNTSQTDPIDEWMAGVFHGLPMINPQLTSAGFGISSDGSQTYPPNFQTIAALNVRADASGTTLATPTNPIMWPSNGNTVPLTTYAFESPDARSMFGYINNIGPNPQGDPNANPAYGAWPDAGVPIFLQLGQGNIQDSSGQSLVQASSLRTSTGSSLDFHEIDETNYAYPDPQNPSYTGLGQNILHAQGAVVLLPRQPLAPGSYTASITVNGQIYTWSFSVFAPVTYTVSGLPDPLVAGQTVNGQVFASGGSGSPYTFSYVSLPAGLSLSSSGQISGVVRGFPGYLMVFICSLVVTDSTNHPSSQTSFALYVAQAPITVTPGNPLPNAIQGQPYSVQQSATGGVAPYTFSTDGFSGANLSLSSQGLISGTPPLMNGTLIVPRWGSVTDSNASQVAYFRQITFVSAAQKRSPQPDPTPSAFMDGSLVKAADQPEVYVVYGEAKFWIPNPGVFTAMGFEWSAIRIVSDQEIGATPNVPGDGTLLKEQSTPSVYVMQLGVKSHLLSSSAVVAAGGWEKVRVVPDGALVNIPDGNDIP